MGSTEIPVTNRLVGPLKALHGVQRSQSCEPGRIHEFDSSAGLSDPTPALELSHLARNHLPRGAEFRSQLLVCRLDLTRPALEIDQLLGESDIDTLEGYVLDDLEQVRDALGIGREDECPEGDGLGNQIIEH